MQKLPEIRSLISASIIICSIGRPDRLVNVLTCLKSQTIKPKEIIIRSEEGLLTRIRNQGASEAKGDIVSFIDDDVFLPDTWLEGVISGFKEDNVAGVSGPAVIKDRFKKQRDLFRFHRIKKAYDKIFLEGMERLPGRITSSGAWSTGAIHEGCCYEGEVDFLEACNMSYRRDVFESVGGFDEQYGGIGDWSEPDLSFRIRQRGFKLHFTQKAKLYHEPSRTGAYLKRAHRCSRFENYCLFSRRWIRPYWRHTLYKSFLWSYYFAKEKGLIQ